MATNKELLDSIVIAVNELRADEDVEDDDFTGALSKIDGDLWDLVDHFEGETE